MARLWALLGVVALLWSAAVGALWLALEEGNRLVFEVGRWFGTAPAQMVWLTEILHEAGPATRIFLLVLWVAGLGLLAGIGAMIARAR